MKRDTRSAFRARAAATERQIDQAVESERAERRAEWEARKAAHAANESSRHRYTRDELDGVQGVRTADGWHPVVRVNAKTVTVHTPYSWTLRIPFDRILAVMRSAS
jgi:hypothetical protein